MSTYEFNVGLLTRETDRSGYCA